MNSLINSGEDATLDSVISASTFAAAVIFMLSGVSLEAWLGALISLVIIRSGFEMLGGTVSQILGERSDPELAKSIKQTVTEFEGVQGAYDLVLNNYGPDAWNGSIHIEVPDTFSADRIDRLIREIQIAVYTKHQVILTAVGVYSVNTTDEEAMKVEQKVREIVFAREHVLQMHGFYLTKETNTIRFDVVISFDAPDRRETFRQITEDVQKAFPEHQLQIALDTDFSET